MGMLRFWLGGGQLVIERAAVREREGRAVAMTVKEMPVD
jgi:hypothetical protein